MASQILPTIATAAASETFLHSSVEANADDGLIESVATKRTTMKCALIRAHGDDVDELLSMSNSYPMPKLVPPQKTQVHNSNNEGLGRLRDHCHLPYQKPIRHLLVKVRACALAPGDIRVMKGHCDLFQNPPEGFPYVPGGDISGVVEEVSHPESSRFKKGDRIISMFDLPRPVHGLAEYVVVKESNTEIIPDSISFCEAAAVTSSAVAAYLASTTHIAEPGLRILILGGNGGVGTFLIQFAKKLQKASYIVVTSSTSTKKQEELLSLGADRIVDYTKQVWYEDIPEFEDNPFDVIFDLGVGKKQSWVAAKSYSSLLKPSCGKYVTFSGHNPELKVHNVWQAVGLMTVMYSRMIGSACNPMTPQYVWHNGLDIEEGVTLKQLLQLVEEKKIVVVLDPVTPVPFTLDGIRQGYHLMNSRHAHGKVVIEVLPSQSDI